MLVTAGIHTKQFKRKWALQQNCQQEHSVIEIMAYLKDLGLGG